MIMSTTVHKMAAAVLGVVATELTDACASVPWFFTAPLAAYLSGTAAAAGTSAADPSLTLTGAVLVAAGCFLLGTLVRRLWRHYMPSPAELTFDPESGGCPGFPHARLRCSLCPWPASRRGGRGGRLCAFLSRQIEGSDGRRSVTSVGHTVAPDAGRVQYARRQGYAARVWFGPNSHPPFTLARTPPKGIILDLLERMPSLQRGARPRRPPPLR